MDDRSVTTTLLLEALRDGSDEEAWHEFDARYRPVVRGVLVRMGVPRDEREDAAQDVLLAFVESYRAGRYEPGKGRLRSWLRGIARNRVLRGLERRTPLDSARGESRLAEVGDLGGFEAAWDEELRRHLLSLALAELRRSELEPRTVRAFVLHAVEGRPADEVAAELGTTANAVHVAAHRCREKLRAARARLEAVYRDG